MMKMKMVEPKTAACSPSVPSIPSPRPSAPSTISAYDHYLRLPELLKLWTSRHYPQWPAERLVKPSLQALEITFRFISLTLSDKRPYTNRREWPRRLQSLATHQLELIALLCNDEESVTEAPTCQLTTSAGVLTRDRSSQEVWKVPGSSTSVVSRTSEQSLLPRLTSWDKSHLVASKIHLEIEAQMYGSPFTLGLGEPNLSGKPILDYDLLCLPSDLHSLKNTSAPAAGNENQTVYTSHQILETWVFVGKQLLDRIGERIEAKRWGAAASDCWLLEQVWKLLTEIEDLHLLMDPDDFLRLMKRELGSSSDPLSCFRSTALMELTRRSSRDLKARVPETLAVEVDPEGGPRLHEAAMKLFSIEKWGGGGWGEEAADKIQMLQAFQAVDAAVKRFFFAYGQLIVAVMGSLECSGRGGPHDGATLDQIYMEPPYFPSLDSAKTFLSDFYQRGGRKPASLFGFPRRKGSESD